jgi:hypothetical protein
MRIHSNPFDNRVLDRIDYFRPAAPSAATAGNKIAFRTRSEEEVLDDGYKWRKYGRKSVKNSPNPR